MYYRTSSFSKRVLAVVTALLFLVALAGNLAAETMSPEQAKNKIVERLERHDLLKGNDISVSVADGEVTLTGNVASLSEKKMIRDIVNNVDSDWIVRNELEIRDKKLSDAQIASDINDALDGNVFYSVYDWVWADVRDGVVTMHGYAHEPYLHGAFLHQAEKTAGVKEVIDEIKVLPASVFDDEIRHQAAYAIYQDPSFEPYSSATNIPIHIIVNDGKVWLKGQVNSEIEKVRAENLVNMHSRAFQVINDLTVMGNGQSS